jgi:hypothetical protein
MDMPELNQKKAEIHLPSTVYSRSVVRVFSYLCENKNGKSTPRLLKQILKFESVAVGLP